LVLDGKHSLFLKHSFNMRLYLVFLLFHLALLLSGQGQSFKVRAVSTDSFPTISGQFWVRNPIGLDPSRVHFWENEVEAKVDFGKKTAVDALPKNKRVVFLIVNGPSPQKLSDNLQVVLDAIPAAEINAGDQMDVVSFSCLERSGNILLGLDSGFAFTDSKEELKGRLQKMGYVSRNGLNCQPISSNQSDINYAVYKTLEELEKVATSMPTAIVVVGDNKGVRRSFSGEGPVERAKRLNVAIYSVTYPFANSLDMHSETLAEETYGIFYNSTTLEVATGNLEKCLKDIIPRSQGCYYPFSYSSSLKKEGLAQTVIIRIDRLNETGAFIVNTPRMNVWEMAKDNPILAAIFAVVFLMLCGLMVLLILTQKKKKEQEKRFEQERLTKLKEEQETIKNNLAGSNSTLEGLLRQTEEQELERAKKMEREKREQKKAAALKRMIGSGRLAFFEYYPGGVAKHFEISEPELLVGRGADCHWVLADSNISRNHFKVVFNDEGKYVLHDLNSSNGIFVNDRKATTAVLNHGDVIDFGGVRAIFYV